MVAHDGMVGQLLNKLDDLGIADNALVGKWKAPPLEKVQ
jgi:arylsulfatase A-like enzyme